MLYGSHARGSADDESDVDVLQLVPNGAVAYSVGSVNVTQYLAGQLRAMAQRGSLFVLHLTTEGRILYDPNGELRSILQEYSQPHSYDAMRQEIMVAGSALDTTANDASKYVSSLGPLAIYLLRTVVFSLCAERGVTTFESHKVAAELGDPDLGEVLKLRRQSSLEFTTAQIDRIRKKLSGYLGDDLRNRHGSIVALALQSGANPQAQALLSNVLSRSAGISYTEASLLPL